MRESTEQKRDTNGDERAQTELLEVCFCFCSGSVFLAGAIQLVPLMAGLPLVGRRRMRVTHTGSTWRLL